MMHVSDAIVIGGGPTGSFAAMNIARHSFDVTVFEEHSEIGVPLHCAGHLGVNGLKCLGLHSLPEGIIENSFYGATFYSAKGRAFSIRFSSPMTCAVNRSLFDKHVASLAEDAGARYFTGSRVESLIIEEGAVKGAIVRQNGRTTRFLARIVIDAEGVSSKLLRQTGLLQLDRHRLINGVEAEVENVQETEPRTVEVFLGSEYSPGFYAWLIPKHDGRAKVGLGAKTGNLMKLLQKFMLRHPVASKRLHAAKILQMAFHPMTLGGPIPKAYCKGFLVVGDAASQVKPTTGGGVIFGMTCANIAADVASTALMKNDVSVETLRSYQRLCGKALGFDVGMMLRVRKMLDSMSDGQVDEILDFCARLGLDRVLRKAKDPDFQGRLLINALRSPRVLAALGFFSYTYLSGNPKIYDQ